MWHHRCSGVQLSFSRCNFIVRRLLAALSDFLCVCSLLQSVSDLSYRLGLQIGVSQLQSQFQYQFGVLLHFRQSSILVLWQCTDASNDGLFFPCVLLLLPAYSLRVAWLGESLLAVIATLFGQDLVTILFDPLVAVSLEQPDIHIDFIIALPANSALTLNVTDNMPLLPPIFPLCCSHTCGPPDSEHLNDSRMEWSPIRPPEKGFSTDWVLQWVCRSCGSSTSMQDIPALPAVSCSLCWSPTMWQSCFKLLFFHPTKTRRLTGSRTVL